MIKKIHNVETGEIIEHEMTADELVIYEKDLEERQALLKNREAEQAAKDAARKAVLDKLGLTADEVAALLS